MRRYIGPLIALVVFAVLLAIVLLTQGGNNAGQPAAAATPTVSAADKELQILNLGPNDTVNQLELKTITQTVTLKLDNNNWKQVAPKALDLDSGVISDTVKQLGSLKGTTLIPADKAGDLATFGLDKPSLTVTLNTTGGAKVLNVGALNQATNNYYVKLADDAKVWAVSSFYINTLQTWLAAPPTPAPTIAPAGNPQTPLPTVTATPTATPPPTPTVPATTAPPATTAAATTPPSTTAATP